MTFKIIYEYITDRAPQLAPKNTYCIHEWIASGYDTEKDIIPAVEISCKRGTKSIYSFSFFTPAIKRQHEIRLKESRTPTPISKDQSDELRAKNIRWHKERGITSLRVGPADFEWLAEREAKENPAL